MKKQPTIRVEEAPVTSHGDWLLEVFHNGYKGTPPAMIIWQGQQPMKCVLTTGQARTLGKALIQSAAACTGRKRPCVS